MNLQGSDNTHDADMASQEVSGFMPMGGGHGGGAVSEADFAWFLLGGNSVGGNIG